MKKNERAVTVCLLEAETVSRGLLGACAEVASAHPGTTRVRVDGTTTYRGHRGLSARRRTRRVALVAHQAGRRLSTKRDGERAGSSSGDPNDPAHRQSQGGDRVGTDQCIEFLEVLIVDPGHTGVNRGSRGAGTDGLVRGGKAGRHLESCRTKIT